MPTLSRWFIKSGLIYFVLTMILAVLLKLHTPGLLPIFFIPALTPVFYHTLTVGWITQIIFGVSIWMFPRYTKEQPRGNEQVGWASFWCLNGGLLFRVFGEPLQSLAPSSFSAIMVVAAAVLQWLGGMLYVVHIWQRVKGKAGE